MKKPIPSDLKVIFFDAAETLFKTRGSVGDIYLKIARKYGSPATKEAVDEAFFNVFRKKPPPVFPSSEQSERRASGLASPSRQERTAVEKSWWHSVVKEVFTEVGMIPSFEDYFQEVYSVFKGSQGWELFPETFEVLTGIREKGYRIGLITNFDTRIYEVNRALGIDHLIDSMTLSSEAGAPKPDPRIFLKALAAHQIKSGEALHVGDSISDDVRGALKAGIHAVLIDRHRLFKPEKDFLIIESLDELLDFL